MNVNAEINREIKHSIVWLSVGILALFIGYILNIQKPIMSGIAIGFIPVGIGQIIIYTYMKKTKNKNLLRNFELEKEERNVFINTKAGYTAFWISYGYIALALILVKFLNLSLLQFLILTLFLMSITYFALIFLYHKKY